MGHRMKFGESFIEQLKTSIDIVHVVQGYVRLRKSGSSFTGNLPVSPGKDTFVSRPAKSGLLLLLWLRCQRRCHQFRSEHGAHFLSGDGQAPG